MAATAPLPPAEDAFAGFPDEALLFYEGLEADNSRAYWSDHAEVYDRAVRAPMLALIAAVDPEFGPMKFFRPQRDLRFSADKSPYKTHAGAVSHSEGSGAHYVQVSAAGLLVAGGYYRMAKDQVERYRAAVDDDADRPRAGDDRPAPRGRRLRACTARSSSACPAGSTPAIRAPTCCAARAWPRSPTSARRSGWARRPRSTHVVATWRRIEPLGTWLGRHVGPPEPVDGDQPVRVRR